MRVKQTLTETTVNDRDRQKAYWDSVAEEKKFTHPIRLDILRGLIPLEGSILDYGCGYGRTCAELMGAGFANVIGVDISSQMIKNGLIRYPNLNLRLIDGGRLPFSDNAFSACIVLAVLTCMPTNNGQIDLVTELHRVLKSNGLLYLSDYPLQRDRRNNERYSQFEEEFGTFGVFRLPDGGVVRHHQMNWIYSLLSEFKIIRQETLMIPTMNGNPAEIFQIIARKK